MATKTMDQWLEREMLTCANYGDELLLELKRDYAPDERAYLRHCLEHERFIGHCYLQLWSIWKNSGGIDLLL